MGIQAERRTTDGGALEMHADYKYDAFANRIEKSVDADGAGSGSAVVTKFALDGWKPNYLSPSPLVGEGRGGGPIGNENWDVWADMDGSGSLTTRYLRGDVVDEIFARTGADGSTYWYLNDRLGSIRDVQAVETGPGRKSTIRRSS